MLQLTLASKHISEDDDEWQGLLRLALINKTLLSPLNIYYRRRVDTCPSVNHLSFCPSSKRTQPSPIAFTLAGLLPPVSQPAGISLDVSFSLLPNANWETAQQNKEYENLHMPESNMYFSVLVNLFTSQSNIAGGSSSEEALVFYFVWLLLKWNCEGSLKIASIFRSAYDNDIHVKPELQGMQSGGT